MGGAEENGRRLIALTQRLLEVAAGSIVSQQQPFAVPLPLRQAAIVPLGQRRHQLNRASLGRFIKIVAGAEINNFTA